MKLVPPDQDQTASVEEADFKTLKLAAPLVSAESLGRYLAFQRAYVEALEKLPKREPRDLAEAHRNAAQLSGASNDEISRVGSMCTDFAGRRGVELKLTGHHEKVKEAIEKARLGGVAASEKDLEVDKKIREELASGSAYEKLAKRYGKEAIEVLRGREAEILELHRRQLSVHV